MTLWLADACALVGFYRAAPTFPTSVRLVLENDTASVAVAATTVWEIAVKVSRGKLSDIRVGNYGSLADMLRGHGFTLLPLEPATAEQAAALPPIHADPFDRALVALAQRTGRTILTSDRVVAGYGVPVSW